ncbi:MAG: hypothetical protein H0T46_04600 [Deltaproteobacteria bacterium]|nr:hypothetical protein [Deltaproteobacteria bacterium]
MNNVCRKSSVLVALLASCAEPEDPEIVTAPGGPIAFSLSVRSYEPYDRFPPAEQPRIYIDGVEQSAIEQLFPSIEAADDAVHLIELRYGSAIVRKRFHRVGAASGCPDVHPTEMRHELCAYWSGDIRFGSSYATGRFGTCVGDGFCAAGCGRGANPCPDGERCTSRATLLDPFASHLACAPIGPKRKGEACALIDATGGAYDDCAGDLLCVEGTCQAVCTEIECSMMPGCRYVPGQPPELRLCPAQDGART